MNKPSYGEMRQAIIRTGKYQYVRGTSLLIQDGRVLLPNGTWIDYYEFNNEVFYPIAEFTKKTLEL